MRSILFVGISIVLLCSCRTAEKNISNPDVVLTGLDGRVFLRPELSESSKARLDTNLSIAHRNFSENPSEENYIWLGRREAYLYNYERAISIFSDGLAKFPNSYKLYRHRGHRYITMRQFDNAIADLSKAVELMPAADSLEIEPDGQPNAQNIPLSSTQFNVWYHLALAKYLKGDFQAARADYDSCMNVSVNDDLVCATADWQYMTLRRLGEKEQAEKVLTLIRDDMKIIENDSYFKRLMMYKGVLPADSVLNVNASNEDVDLALATQGYGVGNWYLYNGDKEKARQIFEKVVGGKHFSAFGFIASEAELVRMK
jgi:tetratricopeptide (TPR) repeat protein